MILRMIVYMATGVFIVSIIGIAQAAGLNNPGDCWCLEGPSATHDSKQSPVITKVVDEGPLYIEGMGFAPRDQEPRTIVPKISDRCDWCSEGYTKEELEYIRHIIEVNKAVPAAGR